MFYGSPREHDLDFGSFSVLFRAIFLEGLARPRGGIRAIIKPLVRRFKQLGGELRLRAGVKSIMPDGDAITVLLDDGTQLSARQVISSAGWHETMRLCQSGEGEMQGESRRAAAQSHLLRRIHFHARLPTARSRLRRNDHLLQRSRPLRLCPPRKPCRSSQRHRLFAEQLPLRCRQTPRTRRRHRAHHRLGQLRSLGRAGAGAISSRQARNPRAIASFRRAICPRFPRPCRRPRHIYSHHHPPLHRPRRRGGVRFRTKTVRCIYTPAQSARLRRRPGLTWASSAR